MTISEAVHELQQRKAIRLDGHSRLEVRLPRPLPQNLEPVVQALRQHRAEAVRLLQSSAWPPECLAAERKFRIPAAALYPLLNHPVLTPAGTGTLLQVFDDRVAVYFKGAPGTREFRPEEIAVAADARQTQGARPWRGTC